MARYVCNPIEVDAFQIVETHIPRSSDGSLNVLFDDGSIYNITSDKIARMFPKVGDYLVRTHKPDEYEYLNPKHVFEAKYTKMFDEA